MDYLAGGRLFGTSAGFRQVPAEIVFGSVEAAKRPEESVVQ
jgi:hypothetical protein